MYDNDDQASFVLLGDAGYELVGRKASELVARYFEVITKLCAPGFETVFSKIVRYI